MAWLDRHGVVYETLDVTRDAKAWEAMVALSGQTFAPVIEVGGKVLADFGAAELAPWWQDIVTARGAHGPAHEAAGSVPAASSAHAPSRPGGK